MELQDSFKLMDTKVMDRIMKDYWNSNIDTSGSFFNNSTCFQILTVNKLSYIEDYERTHRFYHERDVKVTRPHPYMYKVYVNSMQMRYFIEICTFSIISIFFQFFINAFNKDLHKLNTNLDLLDQMRQEGFPRDEIDHEEEKVRHEMTTTAIDLEFCMIIACLSFTFPIRMIVLRIYARFTGR